MRVRIGEFVAAVCVVAWGVAQVWAAPGAIGARSNVKPLPNSRPLHRGRILTVPMESAPAGQVAAPGAVVRPESDDGNHPSKSRT